MDDQAITLAIRRKYIKCFTICSRWCIHFNLIQESTIITKIDSRVLRKKNVQACRLKI